MEVMVGERLRKRFGNVKAVDGVSIRVMAGEVLGIIGPNGAGKTTLLNLISGILKPDSGKVMVRWKEKLIDITGWGPAKIAKLGVARAFQIPNIFDNMSVIDNLRSALMGREGYYSRVLKLYDRIEEVEKEAWRLLRFFGLEEKAEEVALNLSHGEKKVLDIALALALKPTILLMDEPTAGLSAAEKPMITELIGKLKRETGVAIVVVEHDLDVIFSISDRVMAMHEGRLLAEGSPDQIRADARVKEAYFGEEI